MHCMLKLQVMERDQKEVGEPGIKTLINTIDETAGDNCENGGVKIEVGSDTNDNGVLDTDEVDETLTRYVCNGTVGNGSNGNNNTLIYTIKILKLKTMKKLITLALILCATTFIQAQNNLEFSRILLIDLLDGPQTVPAGTVWKIVAKAGSK